MNPLITFYNNESEREAVKAFLIECLKESAVEKAFAGEPVTGIRDANELILRAFDMLSERYAKKEEPKISNSR